jgi:hypothetical protein
MVTNAELAIHRAMEAPYGCMEPVYGFQETINCKDVSTMTKIWLQEKTKLQNKTRFLEAFPMLAREAMLSI